MMTSIILQGSLLNREISSTEIEAIKSAKSINDVGSIWGKIADWFCGTKKEEAKASLFKLLNNQGNTIEEFKSLRNMASAAYKDRFEISAENKNHDGNVKLKLSININNDQNISAEADFTLDLMKQMCRKPSKSEIQELGNHMDDVNHFSSGLENILYRERHTKSEQNGTKIQQPLINLWRNGNYDDVLKNKTVVDYIKGGIDNVGMMKWLSMA